MKTKEIERVWKPTGVLDYRAIGLTSFDGCRVWRGFGVLGFGEDLGF